MSAQLSIPMPESDKHTGFACYMRLSWGKVAVLCPYGHVVASVPADQWSDSHWNWKHARGEDVVTCGGTLPPDAKPYPRWS